MKQDEKLNEAAFGEKILTRSKLFLSLQQKNVAR